MIVSDCIGNTWAKILPYTKPAVEGYIIPFFDMCFGKYEPEEINPEDYR